MAAWDMRRLTVRPHDTYIHTYMHTYIHTVTYIPTYMHTYLHTYMRVHTYVRTYIHTYNTSGHTYTRTYTLTCLPTYIHTQTAKRASERRETDSESEREPNPAKMCRMHSKLSRVLRGIGPTEGKPHPKTCGLPRVRWTQVEPPPDRKPFQALLYRNQGLGGIKAFKFWPPVLSLTAQGNSWAGMEQQNLPKSVGRKALSGPTGSTRKLGHAPGTI